MGTEEYVLGWVCHIPNNRPFHRPFPIDLGDTLGNFMRDERIGVGWGHSPST